VRIFGALAATVMLLGPAFGQEIPRPAPDYTIHLSDGGQVQTGQYTGKVVLLAFMATTCPHCQQAVKILSAIQKEYGPRGLQILGATFNDDAEKLVAGFVSQFQPAFPVGYCTRESVSGYLRNQPGKRSYVPIFIFIDRQQVIREQHSGEEPFFADEDKNVRAVLDKLLKQPAPVKKSAKKAA